MSEYQSAIKWNKWIHLNSWSGTCTGIHYKIPTGTDRNNYIVIEIDNEFTKINCIHKYNIDNDKWTKIDGFNDVKITSVISTALDVHKQILFLLQRQCITQMQLDNNNVINDTHNIIMKFDNSKSIIVNNSLFALGGEYNNSILKWDSEKKTFTKFSDMYNKMNIGRFGMIYNNKHNCL
eukprot:16772_1